MNTETKRPLTVEETASLLRLLDIEIGHKNARAALRLIDSMGAGIFMPVTEPKPLQQHPRHNSYNLGSQC